jgi:hypothetical protein
MEEAKAQYQETGCAARLFKEFVYQTRKSWSCARRVVAKAEYLEKGENPRFVVTSLNREAWPAQELYEQHYCARGDMENRIKEQLMLFSDRTSTHYQSIAVVFFFDRLRAVADAAATGTARNRVGQGPVLHDSGQVAKDRRADPHHHTQGVDFTSNQAPQSERRLVRRNLVIISNPQLNPQRWLFCTTSAYFGSPRGLVSRYKA